VGMGLPMCMGMGIEIPSPHQPWTLPWVCGSPCVWYGDRNSVHTSALDSAVGMWLPMCMGMGIEIPSPHQPWTLPWVWGSPCVCVWCGYGDRNSVSTAALMYVP